MKKKLVLCISLLCSLFLLSAYAKPRITTTNGWMMKMEDSELTKAETKLIALTQSSLFQQFYVPLAGSKFWDQFISEDQTFEDYAKNTIVFEEAAALTILNAIADSWELKLSDLELEKVSQAANEYINTMSSQARHYTGANRKDVIHLISKYVRACNVIQLLAEDLNMEVSDNEMRVMDIQVIMLSDYTNALQIKEQLDAGADFTAMAKQYSISDTLEYSVKRGDLNSQLEQVVFSMDGGTISEIITVENEYYIIKCTSDYNPQLSEQNRTNIQQQRIYDNWMNTIEDFSIERKLEFNQHSWNKMSMELKTEAQDTELFRIIQQYFPQ
ncbi:MAG: peptidylprolyl isomerase [Clostridiales bacterium]|nr:peptidylprolyl isomerase [Clostridiales bacterium]